MEFLRDRSVRFAAGLTVAIAIPVAVLFYFQFRSISALSQSSAVVLRQLSQETADGLAQELQDSLQRALQELDSLKAEKARLEKELDRGRKEKP